MITLHRAQLEALQNANEQRGFAFFMEMGLGKTLTVLTEFHKLAMERKATRLVVICPNSFKAGWQADAEKWGIPLSFFIWGAGKDAKVKAWYAQKFLSPPVLVLNYEAIRSESVQKVVKEFTAGKPCYLAIDESIRLKNPKSVQTKAILSIAREFDYVRVLSGKPQTQGPHDLWAQLRAIGQLDGVNYYAFKTLYCRMGGYMNKQVIGSQNTDHLARRMEPYSFYATKAEYAQEIPEKTFTQRNYKQHPEVERHYETMKDEFMTWLNSGEAVSVELAITKYMKLAQIQTGFIIDEAGETHPLIGAAENPRIELLKDIIEEEVTGKVVVPYWHRYSRVLLAEQLAAYRPAYIAGGMLPETIEAQKKAFNEDPNCRVILLQISAAKYGHTLLGGPEPENACSTMVFYENSYSLDDRSQIEDRIHRHGQRFPCTYIDLVGSELDWRVVTALQNKERIFQSVFQHFIRARSPAA